MSRVGRPLLVALGAALLLLPACALVPERPGETAPRVTPPRPAATASAPRRSAPRPSIPRRRSASVGLPWAGELRRGVQLPVEGRHFFTWDPVLRRSPGRGWRRFGSDRLVGTVVRVIDRYAAAHVGAPRVGIGDLSRRRGGDFGARYGLPGHASHQNGLDVDVYFPRLDRRERPPEDPEQIDRPLAQDLVDRFVRAGAQLVFVGPGTGLVGPPGVVQVLAHHDNHLHVRLPAATPRRGIVLGRSASGRPIRALTIGPIVKGSDPGREPRTILVVGCIHGTECAGTGIVRRLLAGPPPRTARLWLIPNLNPDGFAAGTRQNGRGVDLNRNFPSEWRPIGRRFSPQFSGTRPFSEPETQVARRLILRVRPALTLWFHQPQALVRAWGASIPAARRYARLAGEPFRALRWPNGTAPNWQNHRFPGTSSFVVELPAGPLVPTRAAAHARAILRLAAG